MEIWNDIYGVAMPIIVTGMVGFLVKIIYQVGDVAIKYGLAKLEHSNIAKELATHEKELTFAKEIWNVVEEKFRVSKNVEDLFISKADMFDELLLQKIPYLTKDELVSLRQAIAGEFNKGKEAVINDTSLKQPVIELQGTNAQLNSTNTQIQSVNDQLTLENEQLKAKNDKLEAKLLQITSTVSE